MGLSVAWLVPLSQIAAFVFLWKYYEIIHRKTKFDVKGKGQHLHFKSIFWAFFLTLGICNAAILFLDWINFLRYAVLYSDTKVVPVSITLLCGLLFLLTINAAFSLWVTVKSYRNRKMIALPKLLNCFKNKRCTSSHICNKCHMLFIQFLVIGTLTLSSSLSSFHISGIAIAALVNPSEVLNKLIFAIVIVVILFFTMAYIIEGYESGHIRLINLPCIFFLMMLLILFCAQFTFSYAIIALFVSVNNYQVVNMLGQVFPLVLITIITKWVYMEYRNYTKQQSSTNVINGHGMKKSLNKSSKQSQTNNGSHTTTSV